MSITPVDHVTEGHGRLITQYSEAESVKNYLLPILTQITELEEMFCDLINNRNIDDATDATLDIIGSKVGQTRAVLATTVLPFFGFFGVEGGLPFATYATANTSSFKSYNDSDEGSNVLARLTDAQYRLYIRARIIKNYTLAKRADVIRAINFLIEPEIVIVQEGVKSYTVNIGKVLSVTEQSLISRTDLIPKPLGIDVEYTYFDFANYTTLANLNSITTTF